MKKTVFITGAAKGIGRKIAIDFARSGHNVCINYNKSDDMALSLAKILDEEKCTYIMLKGDISRREEVNNMVKTAIENFGRIDILVNNAGISEYKLFTDITNDDFMNMINVSIIGMFNITQEILKMSMIKNKYGKIVNMSSMWGQVGAACEVHYSTVKAGIIGFTKALAKEVSLSNITVNAVAPGVIDTDMISSFNDDEKKALIENIPLGRIGNVEDVSNLVLFLASDNANYITGQVVSPNGGMVT